jgi:ketosteroid isomerase-like protein
MQPDEFLAGYERALATHQWEAIAPFIDHDACFIFSDGTHFGLASIEGAIRSTFQVIQNEVYHLSDMVWIYRHADSALCTYRFHWSGLINGAHREGQGRGSSVLVKRGASWKIIHEHLSAAEELDYADKNRRSKRCRYSSPTRIPSK